MADKSSTPLSLTQPQTILLLASLTWQAINLFCESQPGSSCAFIEPTFPEPIQNLTTLFAHDCFKSICTSSVFGYVAEFESMIVVAFRGSKTIEDYIHDADIRQVEFNSHIPNVLNVKVERGFYTVYTTGIPGVPSLRDQLINILNNIENTSKPLFVTGHSLGAAIATLAALDISANTPFKKPSVYTFASPRVGSPEFALLFDFVIPTSVRVVNTFDLIPGLPPALVPIPHFGTFFYQHVKGKFPISVNASKACTHLIQSGYWPGLIDLDPDFANKLICCNPPGFTPNNQPCVNTDCTCVPQEPCDCSDTNKDFDERKSKKPKK